MREYNMSWLHKGIQVHFPFASRSIMKKYFEQNICQTLYRACPAQPTRQWSIGACGSLFLVDADCSHPTPEPDD